MTRRPRSRYAYRSRRLEMAPGPVLAALGAPVLLLLLLAGLGRLLPAEQEASVAASFREPPDVLWQVLMDLDNHPSWRRGLTRLERLPDSGGRPAWLEYHGRATEAIRIADARPPLRLVTERVPIEGPPAATWTWELAGTGDGSRLTLTRRVLVAGPLARAVRWLGGGARRDADRALADLAARVSAASLRRTTALHR